MGKEPIRLHLPGLPVFRCDARERKPEGGVFLGVGVASFVDELPRIAHGVNDPNVREVVDAVEDDPVDRKGACGKRRRHCRERKAVLQQATSSAQGNRFSRPF